MSIQVGVDADSPREAATEADSRMGPGSSVYEVTDTEAGTTTTVDLGR